MTLKNRLIRAVLTWLYAKWPSQYKDVLLGTEYHIHKNPSKKEKGVAG